MKFTKGATANGTSLQGYINATYDQLVAAFGAPDYGPDDQGDKVTCEWCFEFENGVVATIYDWKRDCTPYGYYEWHIGGETKQAVWLVTQAFEASKDALYNMVKEYDNEHN